MTAREDRRALLTPAFRKVMVAKSVSHGLFAWTDPSSGRRKTYGDRLGGYGFMFAAIAQAKGWETTVTWVRPRARDRVTVPPFRSPEAALAYLDSMAQERILGKQYADAATRVRQYLDNNK